MHCMQLGHFPINPSGYKEPIKHQIQVLISFFHPIFLQPVISHSSSVKLINLFFPSFHRAVLFSCNTLQKGALICHVMHARTNLIHNQFNKEEWELNFPREKNRVFFDDAMASIRKHEHYASYIIIIALGRWDETKRSNDETIFSSYRMLHESGWISIACISHDIK